MEFSRDANSQGKKESPPPPPRRVVMSVSTAALDGSDGSAPAVPTAMAPAHAATSSAASTSALFGNTAAAEVLLLLEEEGEKKKLFFLSLRLRRFSQSSRAKAARKESPAAVSSTTPSGASTAATAQTCPPSKTAMAPRLPRVTRTFRATPRSLSFEAFSSTLSSSSSSRPPPPTTASSSCRFGVNQSTVKSKSSSLPPASRNTGTPRDRAASANRRFTDDGISRCSKTQSKSSSSNIFFSKLILSPTRAPASSSDLEEEDQLPFAPGTTTLIIAPSWATTTKPRPDEDAIRRSHRSTLTPSSSKERSMSSPAESSPRDPQKAAAPPRRATATAWFRPFPPAHEVNSSPVSDSPAPGSLATPKVVS
mmetsp:Transcript_2434/g.8178  ORF Transcript_2434/g.8178 Transcript_2434/m.8178 type:complete len:366 (-) Transcript_2434:2068-3165(-)